MKSARPRSSIPRHTGASRGARSTAGAAKASTRSGEVPPVEFTVLGSPLSQNRAWRIVRFGKRAGMKLSDEGAQFKALVLLAAMAARPAGWPLDALVSVSIQCVFDSERPDIDGPIKLALDAMQGAMYANDRQVRELRVIRLVDRANPRLEVSVTIPTVKGSHGR